jgi:DNA-directed RNA polymerase subunit RPC12/RpoP
MTERSDKCQNCGAGIHSDQAWIKCECGNRVWLDEELRQRYGNDTPPQAFVPDRHERGNSGEDSDEDTQKNARLDDF